MYTPRFFVLLPLLLCLAVPAHAAALAFDVAVKSGKAIITLTLPTPGKPNVFTLENPPRLVVDIPNFTGPRSLALPASYKGKLLQNVRLGQFNPQTVRIVFELSQMADYTQNLRGKTLTLTLAPSKTAKPQEVTKPPEKPIIVIDAGHGGQDPGTEGPGGLYEKELVLTYASALKKALEATGRYRAVLTRDDDYFILLRERVNIARQAKGDLFISLHADSAPSEDARGLSVYTLSETASDKEAEALAARENRVDVLSGVDLSHESPDVAGILISLAQRETNNKSALLADLLVHNLEAGGVRLLPNSHRFAGFAVLKAPDMPSVLVETGFLSHPQEEKLLKSKKHRDRIVEGLVKGIDAYFQKKQEGVL